MVKKRPLIPFLFFFVLFFLFCSVSFSQIEDDLNFILKANPLDKKIEEASTFSIFHEVSEMKMAFLGLIRLYQIIISSQDKSVCNFTLSCSRFGMAAIQKFGVFHGIPMASDRILRCQGFGRRYYPADAKTGLAIDLPLDVYYLGKNKNKLRS